MTDNSFQEHIPVLARTLAQHVRLAPGAAMVDATVGQAGHSWMFGQTLGEDGLLIGLDMDTKALDKARDRLKDLTCRVILIPSNFARIDWAVREAGVDQVDFILADLGFSSVQMGDREMGLSFQSDMPLDMRIDRSLKITAADIVNTADEKTLSDLIYEYGEDRASRRIARFICERRGREPIRTTGQLASIICTALYRPGHRRQRIHPATRTFQALRIAVNNELDNLKALLTAAPGLLREGGLLAVIGFHSLEDRLVKDSFKAGKESGVYEVLTKRPIVPGDEEIEENRRARSAKLRIARRR